MKNKYTSGFLLLRVYLTSLAVILALVGILCLFCRWPWAPMIRALIVATVIVLPCVLSVHALILVVGRIKMTRVFAWILLFSLMAVLSVIPAKYFSPMVPGKTLPVILMSILSGYTGILGNGLSIAQHLNPTVYENE